MKFKGFDDWIEIFKGGKQTDSRGREHDGDALIDKAVHFFAPGSHEPPLVVGHPQDDSPAFGWVEGLKKTVRHGKNVLLAKFKEVVPEFEELAKKGLYKKRSAAFYADGRLRHVGFLGAAPPAVKGLADLKFDEGDVDTFEFYDPGMGAIAGIMRNLRDWFIEKEGKEKADGIIPDWDVSYIKEEANKPETPLEAGFKAKEDKMTFKEFMEAFKFWKETDGGQGSGGGDQEPGFGGQGSGAFTEADIEAAKKEAAVEERKKADAEFAEKARQTAKQARDEAISDWCGQRVKEGRLLPAWADSGLVSFMQGLDGDTEIEFAEGKDKKSAQEWFREFLEGFGKSAIFKEMATKQATEGAAEFAEAKQAQKLGESIAAKVNPATN